MKEIQLYSFENNIKTQNFVSFLAGHDVALLQFHAQWPIVFIYFEKNVNENNNKQWCVKKK